jgi:hypothetical protein
LVANRLDPAVYRQIAGLLAVPAEAIRFSDDSADCFSEGAGGAVRADGGHRHDDVGAFLD